ncbi:MAG: hypothetical protein U1E65_31625 [Myxococcota bacterium]
MLSIFAAPLEVMQGLLEARQLSETQRAQLSTEEARLGPEHVALIPLLVDLGTTLTKLGAMSEAEELIVRALRISESNNGAVHATTGQLVLLLAQQRALRGSPLARDLAVRAREVLDRTLGESTLPARIAAALVTQSPNPGLQELPREWMKDAASEGLELGVAALRAREVARAIELLSPVVEQAQTQNNPALEAYARGMLAQALFLSGQRQPALLEVSAAIAVARAAGREDTGIRFEGLRRFMESAQPEAPEAPPDFPGRIRRALEIAAAGDPDRALVEVQSVAREAALAKAVQAEASARIVLGQVFTARGEIEQAKAEFEQARALSLTAGDQQAADHVRALLSGLEAPPAPGA